MAMVKTEHYTNNVDILIAPELAFAFPCIVENAGVSANSEGRKIVKAGTPLFGSVDILMNRQTKLRASGDSTYKYVAGVARWDIDVTEGDTNATVLYSGAIDFLKLDEDVQALVTAALSAGGYEPTKGFRIIVMKGAGK